MGVDDEMKRGVKTTTTGYQHSRKGEQYVVVKVVVVVVAICPKIKLMLVSNGIAFTSTLHLLLSQIIGFFLPFNVCRKKT